MNFKIKKTKYKNQYHKIKTVFNYLKKKFINDLEKIENFNQLKLISISHIKNNFIYKKNGEIAVVIELEGVNDSNIDNADEERFFYIRDNFIKNLHSFIKFFILYN